MTRPLWRRWLRRAAIVLGGLTVAVLVLVAAALVLLQTRWGKRELLETVLGRLNDAIRGEVRIDHFEGNLFRDLSLVSVDVYDPDGQLVVHLDRVDTRVTPWLLLGRTVRLDRLRLVGLSATVFDRERRVALVRAFEPTRPKPPGMPAKPRPWTVELDDFAVVGGELRESPLPGARRARDIEVSGFVRIAPGEVSWDELVLYAELPGLAVDRFAVASDGSLRRGKLDVDYAEVTSGAHFARVRGWVELGEMPEVDVTLDHAHVDLAALGTALGRRDLRGEADLSGVALGSLADLGVDVDLATSGGRMVIVGRAGLRRGEPVYDLTLRGGHIRPGAVLSSVRSPIDADLVATVRGAGDPFAGGHATADVRVTAARNVPSLPLPIVLAAEVEAGAIDVTLRARSPDGRLAVARAEVPAHLEGPITASLDLERIDVAPWAALVGRDDLAGRIELLKATATAELGGDAPQVDLELIVSASAVSTPRGQAAGLRAEASLAWSGEGLPTGSGDIELRGLALPAAKAGELATTFVLTPKGPDVSLSGRLRAAGVDGRKMGQVGTLDIPFDLVFPGDGGLPTGTADIHASRVRAPGAEVDELRFDAHVARRGDTLTLRGPLHVERLALGRDLSVATARGSATVSVMPKGLDGAVRVRATDVRTGTGQRAHSVTADLRATIAAKQHAEGRVDAVDVRSGRSIRVGRLGVTFVADRDAGLPEGVVRVRAHDVALPARRLEGVDIDLTVRRGARSRAVVNVRQAGVTGVADLLVEGRLDRRHAIRATIQKLRLSDAEGGLAATPGARVRFDPRTRAVEVEELVIYDVRHPTSTVRVTGRVRPRRGSVQGTIAANEVPVGAWLATLRRFGVPIPAPELDGVVTLNATLSGTVRRPDVDATISVRRGVAGLLRDLALEGRVLLGDAGTRIDVVAAWRDGNSQLVVDARTPARLWPGPFKADTPICVDGMLSDVSFADFEPWLPRSARGQPPAGRVDGTLSVRGTLGEPLGSLELVATHVQAAPIVDGRVEATVALDASATSGVISVQERGTERLRVEANTPVNLVEALRRRPRARDLVAALRAQPLRVAVRLAESEVGALPFAPRLRRLSSARVAADLVLTGSLDEPNLAGFLRADAVRLGRTSADGILRLVTLEDVVTGHLEVSAEGQVLVEADARIPRRLALGAQLRPLLADALTELDVNSRLSAESMSALLPRVSATLSAMVPEPAFSGHVRLRGGRQRALTVDGLAISASAAPGLVQTLQLTAIMTERETYATLLGTQEASSGSLALGVTVEGGFARALDRSLLRAPVQGSLRTTDFRLDGLSEAWPAMFGPSPGVLHADATLTGTLGKPRLAGAVEARFESLEVVPLGLVQPAVTIALDLDAESARLRPLRLTNGGTLDLSLAVRLDGLQVAGALVMERFRIMDRPDLRMTATGQVTVSGSYASPFLQGRLRVDDGFIRPNIGRRTLQDIGPPEDVVFVAELPAPRDREEISETLAELGGPHVAVNITVPPGAIRVRNEIVDLTIGGDLDARLVRRRIALRGTIAVVRGEAELYGRKLSLAEDSRIVFDGSLQNDPTLAIAATYDISDVDLTPLGLRTTDDSHVLVEVRGRARRPRLSLTSDPPMDETSIVSVLTTGQPAGGGMGEQVTVEAQVLTLFTGLALGSTARFVKDNLPVDVLQISPGEDELTRARITVGKRLTRDLLVLYRANLGARLGENTNELRVEYQIKRGLNLETLFGDAGRGSLDLVYHFRY